MAEGCPRPYTASNYYNVSNKLNNDAVYNNNSSFEVLAGNSNKQDTGLVSLRVKNGSHFFKREQGVFMDAPGRGVAPRYQNHFTFKITPLTPEAKSTLKPGESLKVGEKMVSENGAFMLLMQEDGNLCIYKHVNGKQGGFVWCTMKYGFKDAKLVLQTDGNLVVYSGENAPKWSSETHPGLNPKFSDPANKPVKFSLENDGKLKLFSANGRVVWESK